MNIVNHFFNLIIPEGGKGGPSLDTMLAMFDQELENFSTLVQPAPESKPRTPFDSPNVKAHKFSGMRPSQFPDLLSTMLPLIIKMRQGAKLYDGKFQPAADTGRLHLEGKDLKKVVHIPASL